MVFAPEASPNSWELLEMLLKLTCSMICLWGIVEVLVFPTFPTIAMFPETMAPGFSEFMEMVESVGFANILHG